MNGATEARYYYSASFSGSPIGSISLNGTTNTVSGITNPSGPSANRITGATIFRISVHVTGALSSSLEFIISLTMNVAALMSAGSYSDPLSIAVCYDPLFTKPILGSPHQIAVTYLVTGDPIPITHFTLHPYALTVEAATSETLRPTATAVILANGLPPYGAYVSTTASGTAIAATSFQSNLDGSGTQTVTMKNPALWGSGIYSGSVKIQICFDMACTQPANQVPFTLRVTYTIDASAGKDFTIQRIATDLTANVWSSVNQRIRVLAPNKGSKHSNSLIVINPATATIESALPFEVYTYPTTLAPSDDGQYAYVYLLSNNTIVRVLLFNLSINETLQLSSLTSLFQTAVAPGLPHTIAIADSGSTSMLSVYDDLIPRPQRFTTNSPGFFASFTRKYGSAAATSLAKQRIGICDHRSA